MNATPNGPPPERRETVERREIVERTEGPEQPVVHERTEVRNPASTNWIWLLPLLLLVLALVWFIFSRGEPRQGGLDVNIDVPQVEVPTVREERRIEVNVPSPPAQPEGEGAGAPRQP